MIACFVFLVDKLDREQFILKKLKPRSYKIKLNFVSYFSPSDLSIIKELEDLEDARYMAIDEYLKNLKDENTRIGNVIVYEEGRKVYLAYIDKKERHCKVVAF